MQVIVINVIVQITNELKNMSCLLIINLQIPGHFTSERLLCRCAEKPPNTWSGCGSREIGGGYIKIGR